MKSKNQTKVKLLRPLFDSNGFDNIIFADNPKTARGYNNITIILLVLFVFWHCLYSLFADIDITDNNYLLFC